MKHEEFDRALSGDAGIVPSSGFVGGVMDAVRREAAAPPPIPFPWMRALPGLAAGVLALVAMIIVVVKNAGQTSSAAPVQSQWMPMLMHAVEIGKMYGVEWILLALLATVACVALSMRLATGTWRTL
jgi:hypothetical protein